MGNSSSSSTGDRNNGHDGISGGGGGGVDGGGAGIASHSHRIDLHRITGGGSNNNASSNSISRSGGLLQHLSVSLPTPFRSGGSLGLTRAELDARCQPSG